LFRRPEMLAPVGEGFERATVLAAASDFPSPCYPFDVIRDLLDAQFEAYFHRLYFGRDREPERLRNRILSPCH
jgi:hypothetical protein